MNVPFNDSKKIQFFYFAVLGTKLVLDSFNLVMPNLVILVVLLLPWNDYQQISCHDSMLLQTCDGQQYSHYTFLGSGYHTYFLMYCCFRTFHSVSTILLLKTCIYEHYFYIAFTSSEPPENKFEYSILFTRSEPTKLAWLGYWWLVSN